MKTLLSKIICALAILSLSIMCACGSSGYKDNSSPADSSGMKKNIDMGADTTGK